MMLQLNPPLPLDTPKGPADAHFVIDYGSEGHILFVTFVRHSGECWTWQARECQLERNMTGGIRSCPECENLKVKLDEAETKNEDMAKANDTYIAALKDRLKESQDAVDVLKRQLLSTPTDQPGAFRVGDSVEHDDHPGIKYKVAKVLIHGYRLVTEDGDLTKVVDHATPDKVMSYVAF